MDRRLFLSDKGYKIVAVRVGSKNEVELIKIAGFDSVL